jgi:hypothetical protein
MPQNLYDFSNNLHSFLPSLMLSIPGSVFFFFPFANSPRILPHELQVTNPDSALIWQNCAQWLHQVMVDFLFLCIKSDPQLLIWVSGIVSLHERRRHQRFRVFHEGRDCIYIDISPGN